MVAWGARGIFVFLLIVAVSGVAQADAGEWSLGSSLEYRGGGAGLLGATLQTGLNDWISLEFSTEVGASSSGSLVGSGLLQGVVALDVFQWVPELCLGAGGTWSAAETASELRAGLRLRRYFSLEWSGWAGVGVRYEPSSEHVGGFGGVGFTYHFD